MMRAKILSLLFCLQVLGFEVEAQTNPNLYDIPTAENVLQNIRGTDNIDTYAKQRAALYVLWDIAMMQMEKNYQFTDKPVKMVIANQKQEYNNNMRAVYEKYLNEINRPENEEVKEKWRQLWVKYYYHTPSFKEEVITTLFNDRAKDRYYEVTGYQRPTPTVSNKNTDSEDAREENAFTENGGQSDGDLLYQTGKKYFYGYGVTKNQTKAKEFFESAGELNHSGALFSLGVMYADGVGVTENLKKALDYFLIAANLDHPKAQYHVASFYITGGLGVEVDYNIALRYYLLLSKDGINALDPEDRARVYTNIALIYINQDKHQKALDFMKWVRRYSPNDINLEFIKNEANLYFSVEHDKERFKVLMAEAAGLDPDNADYYYNIGVINMEEGNIEEARSAYGKALVINPSYVNASLNLSATYIDEGNSFIDEMNNLGNTQADGVRYDKLKQQKDQLFRRGAKVLEDALKLDPTDQSFLTQLKGIYSALGDSSNLDRINAFLKN